MIAEIASHREELEELCRRFHVRRLDLFARRRLTVSTRRAAISTSWWSSIRRRQRRCRSRPFSASRKRLKRCSAIVSTLSSQARFAIPISRKASSARVSPSLRRDAKSLLWDARAPITAIASMTAGKSFSDFDANLVLRSAVERQFEICGEALNRLDRLDATALDLARVWRAAQDDVPRLRAVLQDLLAE